MSRSRHTWIVSIGVEAIWLLSITWGWARLSSISHLILISMRLGVLRLQGGALFDFVAHDLERLPLYVTKIPEETSFALLLCIFVLGGVLPPLLVLAFVEEDLGIYYGEWLHPEFHRLVQFFIRRDYHRRHLFEVLVERRSRGIQLLCCQRLLPGQDRKPIV